MSTLPLVTYPDPRLKLISEPVTVFDDALKQLVNDMIETMYAKKGVGLAGVQVGVLQRIFVMDTEQDDDGKNGNPKAIINPKIIYESEEQNCYKEGCLSFPGQYADVYRPDVISLEYQDQHGATHRWENISGLEATCIQHELDHLNGVTFVDHLSRMKRDMILRKLKKQQQQETVE